MSVETEKHLWSLRAEHIKRLRVLELIQAQQGANTPVEKIIEIGTIKEAIAEIDRKLSSYGDLPLAEYTHVLYKQQVEIEFVGNYTLEVFNAIVNAIAGLVGIPVKYIRVIQVSGVYQARRIELPLDPRNLRPEIAKEIESKGGRICYKIEMPAESAQKLEHLYKTENKYTQDIGIQSIKVFPTPKENIAKYSYSYTHPVVYYAKRYPRISAVIFALILLLLIWMCYSASLVKVPEYKSIPLTHYIVTIGLN